MKQRIAGLVILTLGMMMASACYQGDQPVYYSKVGFYFEKGRHLTTNYQRGIRVNVNTPVRYLDMGKTHLNIQLIDTGEVVTIQNVPKYSRRSMREVFELMFSPVIVDTSMISKKWMSAIKSGRVQQGMTQDEVLMSMGYPPGHKTPDLSMDTWIYWQSKVDTLEIHFDGDGFVDWIQD